MSRPPANAPSIAKPPAPVNRPSQLPAQPTPIQPSRPGVGQLPAGNKKPDQGQVADFLNMNRPATPTQLPAGDRPGAGNRPGQLPGAERPAQLPAGDRPAVRPPGTTPPVRPNPPHFDRPPCPPHPPGYHPWYFPNNPYPRYHWWAAASLAAIGGWIIYDWATPNYYDYGPGGDVYYQDDSVYVEGKPLPTDDYYNQAKQIANLAPADNDPNAAKYEWLPLGMFALYRDGGQTNIYLQLAVTKEGIIGGTYFNQMTEVSRPVKGATDKTSQRAVWTFADEDSDTLMETGIFNLTKDSVDVLVHFGPDKRQQALLLRVDPPKTDDGKAAATLPTSPNTPAAPTAAKGAELVDDKPRQWFNLAENYISAGLNAKSNEFLTKIVNEYPNSQWADKARQLYEKTNSANQ